MTVTLYRACLVCNEPFPPNEALEHVDLGSRVAFDPGRGRLWQICAACKRWSLVPIESRWEALEELEKIVTDRARLLHRTDNIALFQAGPLEIVRVGSAKLREQAWWRFGREFRDRRERHRRLAVAGAAAAGGVIAGSAATGGISFVAAWLLWRRMPGVVTGGARWLRFRGAALKDPGTCVRCDLPLPTVHYRSREDLVVTGDQGFAGVRLPCPRCLGRVRPEEEEGGRRLEAHEASRVLRRILAYHHFAGSSQKRVEEAVRLIDFAGGTERLPQQVLGGGAPLGSLSDAGQVALEIAVHEESERTLLEMELRELEAHWQREEELAAIIDRELTPGAG